MRASAIACPDGLGEAGRAEALKRAWVAVLFATAISSTQAEDAPPPVLSAITFDLNGDGTPDRAELLQGAEPTLADLAITLVPRGGIGQERSSAGDATGLPRQQSILKKGLAEGHVFSLERSANGSLVVHAGCGGCSNDYETTLTIIHRGDRFTVAGFAFDWDTRESRGACDINLLTGRAVVSNGEAKPKPLRSHFVPIALADWSDERLTALCRVP